MAKKVAVPADGENGTDGKKIKKKHSKCCTCCLVFIIVILVIFAAAFGVGWYIGDKYTREYLDMSLGDTLGVLSDLYWTDDSDVVTNPYSSRDLDGFYGEIKRNILLKDDADVDFDAALEQALESYFDSNSVEEYSLAVQARNSGNGNDGEGDDENSVMSVFVDMIANVMNRDNIDLVRLNNYDEHDPETDEYIFNLNDKQIAAFINSVLKSMLKNADRIDGFSEYAEMIDLSKVFALKQIRFTAQNAKDDAGAQYVKATTADVTVWLGLQSAAGQAISYYMKDAGMGWASGIVSWLGNVILPENVYITLTVPLYGDAQTQINLNDMNAKEQARMYKLINGVLNLSGSDQTVTDMLDEFTEMIRPYLEAAGESMPLDSVTDGTIKVDLLDTLASMVSDELDGDKLTKADFIYVLQALLSDPQPRLDAVQPYRYQNRYIDETGREVYAEGPVSGNLTPINYKRMFVEEIEDKYSLDLGVGDDEDPDLSDVLSRLGLSFDGDGQSDTNDVLDLIDGDKFQASLDRDRADLQITVTDRMLAALLSDQMGALTENGTGMEDMKITLDALTFLKKNADGATHDFAMLVVEIDIMEMLDSMGGDSVITTLAAGIMPENIVLTVTVDITRSLPAGKSKCDVEFILNSCNNTDRALSAIGKFVPELDLQSVAGDIETQLCDMLDKLYDTLDIRLVASTMVYDETSGKWSGELGGITMPDIFTVVVDTALYDENADDGKGGHGKRIVEPDMLQSVLRELNDTSSFSDTPQIADDYQEFLGQVIDKYYLDTSDLSEEEQIRDFDDLTNFITEFDSGKFRISGDDPDVKYLAYDIRAVTDVRENHRYDLHPFMTDKELGALIVDKMNTSDNVGSYTVMDVRTTADSLEMELSIDVSTLLTDDVSFLINTDKVFITATVDLDNVLTDASGTPYAYDTDITVNNMDEETYAATLAIVGFVSDFSIDDQVKDFGKILYEQLDSLNDSISGDGECDNGELFEFTDGGLVMTDFYTFLSNKMDLQLDETTTAEKVKDALQGMYQKPVVQGFPENEHNYDLSADIMRNPPPQNQQAWDWDMYNEFTQNGGTYSDIEFNAMLKYGIESFDSSRNLKVIQTTILYGDDATEATAQKRSQIFDWAAARVSANAMSEGRDYILITFEMAMDKFAETPDKDENEVILPDTVYATVVYELTDDAAAPFVRIDVIFNDMDSIEYDIVTRIMGLQAVEDPDDPGKVNITTVSKHSAEVLNALTAYGSTSFGGQTGGEGVGSFTLAK